MRLRTEGGVTFFDLPEWEVRGARAIYSTRRGGVSEGPYSQLNIGFHVGDDPAAVAENRRRLATATEMPLASWVLGEQVHGCAVRVVGQSQRGAGAWDMKSALPASDALIGHQPGLVLGVHTADCVPVYLYDPVRRAIAMIHAGWRGTVAGIAGMTVMALATHLGSTPAELLALIGPSIGPADYRVDQKVFDALSLRYTWAGAVLEPAGEGQWHCDLWEANRRQLLDAGLHAEAIAVTGLSTASHLDLFYSHRAEAGHTGRQLAALCLL
ncbi:MAG: peptidoglycan editing factor PgeF [Bacillota bacterium]